jgi:pimeloyl-ACP methyl ester carboxylesterase
MANIYKSSGGERVIRDRYRRFLERWPVPNEQLRVPSREGETFVVACGGKTAPPLLLLHGSASNSAMWMGDIAAWAPHFRIYCIDMIGEPGLSAPSRPSLQTDAHALWLDDVMRALSLTRASFVGVSLGGWLALDYAIRRPGRVESLVLLSPAGVGRQKTGILFQVILLRMLGNWGIRKLREMILGRASTDASPAARAFSNFITLIHDNFRPRMERIPIFSDQALQGLTMPLLAIVGGRDVLLDSAGTKRRLSRNVPHAGIRYFPQAAHFIPGQTIEILEFLQLQGAPAGHLR